MKNILISCCMAVLVLASCKKDEKEPQPQQPANTNDVKGSWHATVYDGGTVAPPQVVLFDATATSATAGTANFDITFNGTSHQTEQVTYTLSANNTKIDFVKTGGDIQTLSGGGTWTVNVLNATALEMTSSFGLVIKFAK